MEALEFIMAFFLSFGGVMFLEYDGLADLAMASPSPGVTPEKYARVEVGMTYDEVAAVFDAPGFRTARFKATTTGRCYEMYMWKGHRDYRPAIVFRDGRVFQTLEECKDYPEGTERPAAPGRGYGKEWDERGQESRRRALR